MKKNNMFATPESMDDLMQWVENCRDPYVTTGVMMMYNLMVELTQDETLTMEEQVGGV